MKTPWAGSRLDAPDRRIELVAGILIFIWPAVYLWEYVLPNTPWSLRIYNDFGFLYFFYKAYLLDVLAGGRFPLWSPSEGCGFPFYSNPFTQAFYPLNVPLVGLYKLLGGYSFADHQVYTVFGVCIFSLGLYKWLRSIDHGRRTALLTAAIMSVSFRVTELLRFPNAVHAVAWYPWILLGCTLIARRGKELRGAILVACASVMLLTAGYPYFIYYALFLVVPYMILLSIPATRSALGVAGRPDLRRYYPTVAVAGLVPALICAPYLLKVLGLMKQTVDRGGGSFEYATAHVFGPIDTLGSLVYPPAASMEGWYFFSVAALLIVSIYCVLRFRKDRLFILVMIGWFAVISYITYGRYSVLFGFLWHYLPGFGSLRVWGRLNVVLVPIISLLLARAYAFFERSITDAPEGNSGGPRRFTIALVFAYLAVAIPQVVLYRYSVFDSYWADHVLSHQNRSADAFEVSPILGGVLAFLVLSFCVKFISVSDIPGRRKAVYVALLVVSVSALELGFVGKIRWGVPSKPPSQRTVLSIDECDRRSLSTPRVDRYTTVGFDSVFSVGLIENWYYERYARFFRSRVSAEPGAVGCLLGALCGGARLFFTSGIDYPDVSRFLADAQDHQRAAGCIVSVKSYNGDRLVAEVHSSKPGYFSFIDNWDPDWRVRVNGNHREIAVLFGTFKSVYVDAGVSLVEFEYRPFL